jgi:hypothetical protein
MADFPTKVFEPRVIENRDGVVYNPAAKTIVFAEDIKALQDEIIAIETYLLS